MAIRLINGAEFLHIPKTGGSWVTQVLENNNLIERNIGHNKHADYDRVLNSNRLGAGREFFREATRIATGKLKRTILGTRQDHRPFSPIRFCFVRHPLSWYESWWKYMSGRGWNEWGIENSASQWHPNSILNGLGSNDFNEFVRNVIHKRPGYVSELYYAFTKSGINFIGKNESLAKDLESVLDMIDVPYNKDSLSMSRHVNVSEGYEAFEWDPKLRRTVMMLELPALIHFGYLSGEDRESMGVSENIKPNKAVQATSLCTASKL
jgi:hypothetical protein